MTAPGSPYIRRAVRMTLIVPTVAWLLTNVLDVPAATIPACFAMFALLVFAHFGGPLRDRLTAGAITGLVGLGVVVVACLAGLSVWTAIPATLVGVFAIGYSGVLRGYFAPASAALLVPWIFGITSGNPIDGIPAAAFGWVVGAMAALLANLLVWPDDDHDDLRPLLARCLTDASAMVTARWVHGRYDQAAMDQLDTAIADLDTAFAGRADRPGAATSQDRGFVIALDRVRRLRTALWSDPPVMGDTGPADPVPGDAQLARVTADALTATATSLTSGTPPPDPHLLERARSVHRQELFEWAGSIPPADAADAYPVLASTFGLASVSLTAESLVAGLDPSHHDDSLTLLGDFDRDSITARLAGQWNWQSPWLRKALRTAVAIAVTVLIVKLSGLGFGLWVSLGAMAALKADSSGTRRSAGQIVVGTIGGFVAGALLLTVIGTWVTGYWIVIPIAVFLAAYTPGKTALIVSQSAFTTFILMMVAVSQPGQFDAAEMRVVNESIGVTISLLVSLAMWPHGAAAMVRRTIRAAADSTSAFAASSFGQLTGLPVLSPTTGGHARDELSVAAETLDLAISQRGPGLPDVADWMLVLNTAAQFEWGGRIITGMATDHPLPPGCEQTRRQLVATSRQSHDQVVAAVTSLVEHPEATGSGAADEAPWLAINRTLARDRPQAVAPLDAAAQADTATTIREHGDDPTTTGRGVTAIADAAGWAAQGAQLAQRLTALAAAGGAQPVKYAADA